jgi:hypothetical protein
LARDAVERCGRLHGELAARGLPVDTAHLPAWRELRALADLATVAEAWRDGAPINAAYAKAGRLLPVISALKRSGAAEGAIANKVRRRLEAALSDLRRDDAQTASVAGLIAAARGLSQGRRVPPEVHERAERLYDGSAVTLACLLLRNG